jgi:hypothetical protein
VPRHLVCRVSPTVLAEALPINANDYPRVVCHRLTQFQFFQSCVKNQAADFLKSASQISVLIIDCPSAGDAMLEGDVSNR